MASLSLPRVLQLKKNSVEAEREQFEKFQTLAIQKAINANETPVKEKHVRSTIIGTFQEQSAITYWMVAIRLPIQDNRIVAWKFCHVTHKLLREGHPACLDDSQRHIGMIENLGKLWVHLREGYGKLIHLYCNLLVSKLKFHARNPRFPGNMQLTADELDAIAENDVNNYFQLCVELFDYMDDILSLQASVFDSLGNARANSMTASGQCRLAALIPCAQDASQIYDCNVRLLFRLHASLPPDTLAGHRERFRQQFRKLSSFYKHASSLQYYRNLLTLPVLPSEPPNFLLQSDFGTYVTPVVTIPEQPLEEVDSVGSLIDTSETMSRTPSDHMDDFDSVPTPSPQPDPIVERDRLIDHLQNELKRMRSDVSQLVQERNSMLESMKEHCTRLETQLHTAKIELDEEKHKAEILAIQTPEIKQKLTVTEEKAKIQDEKFQKLKGAYTQLRDEHITLIRQKAEVDKLTTNLKAAIANHESDKLALQQQLDDKKKEVELLQKDLSVNEEIETYKDEISFLRRELEAERRKEVEVETLKASMRALEIEHSAIIKEQDEKFQAVLNELKETTDFLEKVKSERDGVKEELAKLNNDILQQRSKNNDEYRKLLEERDIAMSELTKFKQQVSQEKEEQDRMNNKTAAGLQSMIDNLQKKVIDMDLNHERECRTSTDVIINKVKQSLEINLKAKDAKIKEHQNTIEKLTKSLQQKTSEAAMNKQVVDRLMFYRTGTEREIASLNSQIESLTDKLDEKKKEHGKDQDLLIEKNEEFKQMEVKQKFLQYEMSRLVKDLKEAIQLATRNSKELNDCEKKYDKLVEKKVQGKETETKDMSHLEQMKFCQKALFDSRRIAQSLNALPDVMKEQEAKVLEIKRLRDFEIQNLVNECKAICDTHEAMNKGIGLQSLDLKSDDCRAKDNTINELKAAINFKTKDCKINQDAEMRANERYAGCQKSLNLLKREQENILNQVQYETKFKDEQIRQIVEMQRELNEEIISRKQLMANRQKQEESKRLNAEYELQDLLQHHTVLEADLAVAKRQLEETQRSLEKQTARLMSCAGEAAYEVTIEAIAAFENANAQDTVGITADQAAKALAQLSTYNDVGGNEESIAKSAIFAAHNVSQLSIYVADVANVSTDVELSEKLTNECRSMLTATKECLESVKSGIVVSTSCSEAQSRVRSMIASAAAASTKNSDARSVDDELADMDRAIEEAASQIESMLEASRAGDSGVKLEVNGKILDACTTLMGAVKILVQDARKLQNELGDPKTRQKMYRKNPQWSEGLISAAKAVVFAAKLLVTSADEAVNSVGQTEGVLAAAHEVAGSTAQLVAASRARAPHDSPALQRLTHASRHVAAATGALVAAVKAGSALVLEQEALDTSSLSLTATRRLEMESKVRSLKLETALDAERARLAALRKRHYQLAQLEENGNMENGKD